MSRRILIAIIWCVALLSCRGAGGEKQDGVARGKRVVVPVEWHRVWTAGGAEGDTTLLQPWRLAVGGEFVFVVDKAGQRVAAFRIDDGALAWIQGGKGSGPGEFQLPTALAVDSRGMVWVSDAKNSRLTLFRSNGVLEHTIPLVDFPYPESICPLAKGGVMIATSAVTDPIFHISESGKIIGRMPLPWKDLSGAAPLSVQKLLTSSKDGCVLALALGRGFAKFSESGADTYAYLDEIPLPKVERRTDDGGNVVTESVMNMQIAATSVTAHGEEITISPGGSGPLENRLVDVYRHHDGAYLRSYSTPVPFQQMARAGDIFFFLTYRDGYPALVAVRPEVVATPDSSGQAGASGVGVTRSPL